MISDNEKDKLISIKKLSEDKDFYNNVFKKTEKVLAVVFYVLNYFPKTELSLKHEQNISDKAFQLHDVSLYCLRAHRFDAEETLSQLIESLVALESALRIASAAGLISNDALFLITTETDSVTRVVNNNYIKNIAPAPLPKTPQRVIETSYTERSEVTKPVAPTLTPTAFAIPGHDMSSDAAKVKANLPDRATRIKTVLEAAGEASIKDISDVIRDCSEKTIQRELNSLIEKGEIIRMGERRWSRYSVLK